MASAPKDRCNGLARTAKNTVDSNCSAFLCIVKRFLMATVVTYLLVSNPENPDAVESHPIIGEHGFERRPMGEDDADDALPARKFAVAHPLEDRADLEAPCRQLSASFPEATVTYCEVEERFDHVEHLRSIVFIDGQRAGDIEHGYVFNVGT